MAARTGTNRICRGLVVFRASPRRRGRTECFPITLALAGPARRRRRRRRGRRTQGARAARSRRPRDHRQSRPHRAELTRAGRGRRDRWDARLFAFGDCAGALLAFAATDDAGINAAVVVDARANGVLVNDAGDAARGDFITPAVHRAGAADGDGRLVRTRAELHRAHPRRARRCSSTPRYARAAATLGALRERVLAVVPTERRAAVMRHFAERDIDDLAGMPPGAIEHEVERAVDTLGGVRPERSRDAGLRVARQRARDVADALDDGAARRRRAFRRPCSTMTTEGDRRPGPLARRDRRRQRVRQGAGTRAARAARRLRRAFVQGSAQHAARRYDAGRRSRSARIRATRFAANATRRSRRCRPARASERRAHAGARSCARCGRTSTFDDIRGNVDTRLRKLRDGEYDAIVLAAAGLKRLGLAATHTVPFAADAIVPAVAQGALGDRDARRRRAHPAHCARCSTIRTTEVAVRAERAFLRTLRGGCQAPVGAHAAFDGDVLAPAARPSRPPTARAVLRGERRVLPSRRARAEAAARDAGRAAARTPAARRCSRRPTAPGIRARSRAHCSSAAHRQERPSRIAAALREARRRGRRGGRRPGRTRGAGRPHAERHPFPVLRRGAGDRDLSRGTCTGRVRSSPRWDRSRRPRRRKPAGRPTSWPPKPTSPHSSTPSRISFWSTRHERRRTPRLGQPAAPIARERRDARAGARNARQPRRPRAAAVRRRRRTTSCSRSARCPAFRGFRSTPPCANAASSTRLGVKAVLLFGIPDFKDAVATGNYDPNGVVQRRRASDQRPRCRTCW